MPRNELTESLLAVLETTADLGRCGLNDRQRRAHLNRELRERIYTYHEVVIYRVIALATNISEEAVKEAAKRILCPGEEEE